MTEEIATMKSAALPVFSAVPAGVVNDRQAVAVSGDGATAHRTVIALRRIPHAWRGSVPPAAFRQFTGQMES